MLDPSNSSGYILPMFRLIMLTIILLAVPSDSSIASSGIVVPKRSSIISGLNQQFKQRTKSFPTSTLPPQSSSPNLLINSTSGPQVALGLNEPQVDFTVNNINNIASVSPVTKSPASSLFPLAWLTSRGQSSARRQQQQQQQQQLQQQQVAVPSQHSVLYLDRYQQQLLAANPSLLNPADGQMSNLSLALLTRNSAELSGQVEQLLNPNLNGAHRIGSGSQYGVGETSGAASLTSGQQQQQQQQLYRGYSLIELEVKCDADRRYVRNLYANLSAAINEQASRAGSSAGSQAFGHEQQQQQRLTVSPYVDIDFWSFRYALNDRVDIMVSPKSRPFILGQLNRAKIRHRIKIDDIQARLDQQQLLSSSGSSSSSSATSGSAPGPIYVPALGKSVNSGESLLNGRQINSLEQQQVADHQRQSLMPMINGSYFFDNYQRLAEINQYLEWVVEQNRDVARVKVIGRSSQGRYLRILVLGYEQRDGEGHASAQMAAAAAADTTETLVGDLPSKNASYILKGFFERQEATKKVGSIWLDGGTHAREWISPATTLYLAFRLSDNHYRCNRFYDSLRSLVASQSALDEQTGAANELENVVVTGAARVSRRYNGELINGAPLDPDLIPSINEINSSLLSSASNQPLRQAQRPRTEFEKTMELVAKSPQVLASEFGCDLDMEQLLRKYTFYIMPVLNPDGYEYSHTHNRLWRKTRSVSNHPIYRHFCLGADPNRNYDARHGTTGSSSHPCSQTYAGTVPFTEPETRHQSNFVYANRMNMKMFISFHSYSQMILMPYSHSRQLAPDHKDLESVGQAAVKAIERTHGTQYKVGPSASILYSASGTASDWAYEKAGIKYSYTIELRDTGAYGFLLPKQQIVPTGEETFNGLLAMIDQMEKNDNLLTSKSSQHITAHGHLNGLSNGTSEGGRAQPVAIVDYNHVPDSDQLRSQADQQRNRPPLENILDGSKTWAAPELGPSGVRDRKPSLERQESTDSKVLAEDISSNKLAADSAHLLDEDHTNDEEPDAGYAFEGEGELMEPTRENIIEADKLNEMRLSGRRSHSSRRISQSASLTATGRNSINSPLISARVTTSAPKRESSEDLHEG